MSFFSRKKDKAEKGAPPTNNNSNVTVAVTPSQALAQLSAAGSKDLASQQQQPNSQRQDPQELSVSHFCPSVSHLSIFVCSPASRAA